MLAHLVGIDHLPGRFEAFGQLGIAQFRQIAAAPEIGIARLADSSVTLNVNPWVNVPDYIAAVNEINKAILESFRERKVAIAVPQREVRMVGREA